jgi:hypothetical protein
MLGAEYSSTPTIEAFFTEIQKLAQELQILPSQLETFCNSLCYGTFDRVYYPQSLAAPPDALQSLYFLSRILESLDLGEQRFSSGFSASIFQTANTLNGSSVYKTSAGSFGIARITRT